MGTFRTSAAEHHWKGDGEGGGQRAPHCPRVTHVPLQHSVNPVQYFPHAPQFVFVLGTTHIAPQQMPPGQLVLSVTVSGSQTPEPLQRSLVHGLLSYVQAVPAGCFASGQVACEPSQESTASQSLAAALQMTPERCTLAGQDFEVPVQYSALPQGAPVSAARQSASEGRTPSIGQSMLVPSQVSAVSQTSDCARHTVPSG